MAIRWYRTEDGQDYFKFDVVRLPDDTLRAYIDAQPSYGSRPADGHSTHRYTDQTSERNYICFEPVHPLYTEEQIKRVMKQWAEGTQNYIRTGVFK